jgi:hypothetical protein
MFWNQRLPERAAYSFFWGDQMVAPTKVARVLGQTTAHPRVNWRSTRHPDCYQTEFSQRRLQYEKMACTINRDCSGNAGIERLLCTRAGCHTYCDSHSTDRYPDSDTDHNINAESARCRG